MPDHEILKNQYRNLATQSRHLRADGIYEQALSTHQQCLAIARKMQDEVRIASCYFWIGECLYQLGRKEEALLILAPNLATSAKGSADDLYNSMTKYIIIALDLPAQKQTIEDAIQVTWQYLQQVGRMEWQHKLLYLEAELYQMQGKRDLALDHAIAGWAAWRDEYPLFVADAHLYQIAMFQIRLQRMEDALNTIAEWEANKSNAFPTYRQSVLYRTRSYVSRMQGNLEDARRYAEKAVHLTEQMQTPESLTTMLITSAGASLLMGDFDAARQAIQAIPYPIIKRKAVTLADYHLGQARALCGLRPVDIMFERKFPDVEGKLQANDAICHHLRRARQLYHIGMKRAREFDEAFECTWRQDEIKECLRHVDALETALS